MNKVTLSPMMTTDAIEAIRRLLGSLSVMVTDPNNDDDIQFAREVLARMDEQPVGE